MINRSSNDNRVASGKRVRHGGFAQVLWNTQGAIALVLMAVVLPACTGTDSDSAGPEAGTSVSEVASEPNVNIIGKTVTVSGDIERQVSPKAFTIQSDEFLGGEEVLVVSAKEAPIIEDTLVQVTGTARELTIADVEREYGFDLEPGLEVEIRDQPMIVATGIALKPRLQTIAEKPTPFLGRIVTVDGEVERVIGPNSFTIDNNELLGEEDLLVVTANPVVNLNEDSRVQVTGTVRRFTTTELDKEFNLGSATEYEVFIKDQPAIVSQTTRVVQQ